MKNRVYSIVTYHKMLAINDYILKEHGAAVFFGKSTDSIPLIFQTLK